MASSAVATGSPSLRPASAKFSNSPPLRAAAAVFVPTSFALENNELKLVTSAPVKRTAVNHSVFVDRLPAGSTVASVRELFGRFGNVVSVTPTVHPPTMSSDKAELTVFSAAFVEFDKPSQAKKVLSAVGSASKIAKRLKKLDQSAATTGSAESPTASVDVAVSSPSSADSPSEGKSPAKPQFDETIASLHVMSKCVCYFPIYADFCCAERNTLRSTARRCSRRSCTRC